MLEARKEREFRKSYALYYPVVLSFLVSKVGDMEDAEDICQEVFIRFYNHYADIREKKNWLFTAARFEITNYFNKKATARIDTTDIDSLDNDQRFASEDRYREDRIIIRDIIDDPASFRDEKEKLLFDLVAVYGFSYKEAGRYLDMTRWQVEYKYRSVEKRIAALLKEKGIKEASDLL